MVNSSRSSDFDGVTLTRRTLKVQTDDTPYTCQIIRFIFVYYFPGNKANMAWLLPWMTVVFHYQAGGKTPTGGGGLPPATERSRAWNFITT